MAASPLLRPTAEGLWCEAGGFHVDPWRPVETAIVTHAHADHATPGCGRYIASPNTLEVMRVRFDRNLEGTPTDWGERQTFGDRSNFLGQGLPKGSKILEKAALQACRA